MVPLNREKSTSTLLRYDFLDGLRALLALYVVAHHICFTALGFGPLMASPYFRVLGDGHAAVCFFIVLSGFCLMLPTLKNEFRLPEGAGPFLMRRAWRILPPYYCALLLSLLLIGLFIHEKTGSLWDACLPVTPGNIATHLLLIQNFVPNDVFKINFVFWSISVEWQIYFLFPLLLLGWRSIGGIYTTLAAVLISSLLEKATGHSSHVHFIGLFALGMLAASISFSSNAVGPGYRRIPWKLIAVVTGISGIALNRISHEWVHIAADAVFGVFAVTILVIAAFNPKGWIHALLNFKPLVFVGSFSYSLYLIHAPLIQILWEYPFSSLQSQPTILCLAMLLIGVPLITLVSYLFFLCFEQPFLKKRARKVIHVA